MAAPLGRVVLAREGGGGGGLVDAPLGRVVLAREGGGGGLGGCSSGKSGVSQRRGEAWWMLHWKEWCLPERGAWWIRPLERVVFARERGLVDPTGKSDVSQRDQICDWVAAWNNGASYY